MLAIPTTLEPLILVGDAASVLEKLPAESVNCCVTSPPYFGLRDFGVDGQIGLEETPAEYVQKLVAVFREVHRVLKKDGTLWLNLGDSYANDGKWGGHTGGKHAKILHTAPIGRNKRYTGLKPKDLIGIPWRVAFALQEDGWWLRCDVIWNKPRPMPENVQDRPTKSHEYLFLLSKSAIYHYNHLAIVEPFADKRQGCDGSKRKRQRNRGGRSDGFTKPNGIDPSANGGRNRRSVWTVDVVRSRSGHTAAFPPGLIRPCILAGCPDGGLVLDPFVGSGTTCAVAQEQGRRSIGIDLKPEYAELARTRCSQRVLEFSAT